MLAVPCLGQPAFFVLVDAMLIASLVDAVNEK